MSVSRLSRRGLLAGLGSVAGAAYVAACAGVGGPTPQKEVAPASLTFATFQLPPSAAGVAVEKAIREFEARHPGVTATLEGLTNDQAQDLAKIQTLLAGGTVPDVALSRHHHLGYLASRSAFVPARAPPAARPAGDEGRLLPGGGGPPHLGGQDVGAPPGPAGAAQLLQPGPLRRGERAPGGRDVDLGALAGGGTAPGGGGGAQRAALLGGVSSLWEILVWAWGGEILNGAGNECLLNRPPAPDGMQFRSDLINKSGVVPTSADMGGVGEQAFFTNGRLAAFNTANSALMTIEKDARFRWMVQPLPAGKAGAVTLGAGPNYVVFQGSKQQDAAWSLMADLVLGEGQSVVLANSTLFPGLRTMARPELLPSYKPEWLTVTMKATERARHPHYNHASWPDMDRVFRETLAPLWRGERPAQAVTDEVAREVTPIVRGEVTGAPR